MKPLRLRAQIECDQDKLLIRQLGFDSDYCNRSQLFSVVQKGHRQWYLWHRMASFLHARVQHLCRKVRRSSRNDPSQDALLDIINHLGNVQSKVVAQMTAIEGLGEHLMRVDTTGRALQQPLWQFAPSALQSSYFSPRPAKPISSMIRSRFRKIKRGAWKLICL